MVTYIEFSCSQKSIIETFDKCKEYFTTTISLKDFYLAFFKNSIAGIVKDNTNLVLDNGMLREKEGYRLVALDCSVNNVKGTFVDDIFGGCSNVNIIPYDLEDIEKSVSIFTETTGFPEFFFWKAILKRTDYLPKPYEKFGDIYISTFSSEIFKGNYHVILKNSYLTIKESKAKHETDKKDEKFDKFLDSITKLIEAYKSQ